MKFILKNIYNFYSVAGTVGAIVTCPLEVVKTRLQSSSAFLTPPPRIIDSPTANNNTSQDAVMRPEQRRQLCTTILRKRPQIIAISHCGISSAAKSMSIVQCLR